MSAQFGPSSTNQNASNQWMMGESEFNSRAHSMPIYYPSPSVSRPVNNLTEEEQIKLAKRIGLIQHLPIGRYADHSSASKSGGGIARECVICMLDFCAGDPVRCLPCMHTYHVQCIDDWLMRSLTCPSCLEPVDAALLTTYEAN